jgi:hypothetical protein
MSDDFPLRGVLKHHCGRTLTGAHSKGKNKYIGYYRCHSDNANLNASKIHRQFDSVLQELSLPEHYIQYLGDILKQKIKERIERREDFLRAKKND